MIDHEEYAEITAEELLGKQAEQFFESELGQYVRECAKQDIKLAILEFAECDPAKVDVQKAQTLHFKINKVKAGIDWMSDIIFLGRQRTEQLENAE